MSKSLLISCLQSLFVVILEPKRIKSDTVSTVSPSISHEVLGPDAMILILWMLSFKPTYTHAKKLFSSIFFLVILLLSHKVQGQEYSLIFNVEILASFLVDLLPDDSSPRFPHFPTWQLWMYLLNKIRFSAKRVVMTSHLCECAYLCFCTAIQSWQTLESSSLFGCFYQHHCLSFPSILTKFFRDLRYFYESFVLVISTYNLCLCCECYFSFFALIYLFAHSLTKLWIFIQ